MGEMSSVTGLLDVRMVAQDVSDPVSVEVKLSVIDFSSPCVCVGVCACLSITFIEV